ncbi:DNA helicase IV [Vibrio crassostreae]|uniref:UvrD-helicase domain-containing protein n=1 Tax=Vibrio crassostreae TaxID=246167 RepID=UPI00104EEBC8|nr:UvrD-helicase domain-containing protein [Vibrio crassostreae]TCT63746.1 DNA helicase-4 [Vibrio crassostreae]CAK2015652.1 DNA helicase IV [Vibrio crassostreae]CAK2075329.1 DNA helicase IV [Vibrio crassostreae]CAK2086368.1 DNA helicase IV [Vibrio crassostreae]CAK2144355.1 DNA helicase IV [Vibrio crassostreae]
MIKNHNNKSNFITKIINLLFDKYTNVESSDQNLEFITKQGKKNTINYEDLIDFPIIVMSFWGLQIQIKEHNKTQTIRFTRFSPFYKKNKINQNSIINYHSISLYFNQLIQTKKIEFICLAEKEYLRDSSIERMEHSLSPIFINYQNSEADWKRLLDGESVEWLDLHKSFFPLSENIEAIRTSFENKKLKEREDFYKQIESNPLTPEQRLAVVRENDRNMVLAAAGTGKTSVMVAKALDLIDSGQLTAKDILILAYNNAAAKELRERIKDRVSERLIKTGKGINGSIENLEVSTFHALGRGILKDCNIKTYISIFADDSKKFDKWVHDWLIDYISSSSQAMKNFIAIHFRPADPFDFQTDEEYQRYIRDNEYRSLSGDLVRGYQELLIANWLYLNDIEFEYEPQYVTKVRLEIGFDYTPDFHISNTDIYIEHFGIDRNGNTRPDIDSVQYNKEIESKRELHNEQDTRLIETFHYEWCENNLEASLEKQLADMEIIANPISKEKIFEALNESGVIDNGAKTLQKSLQAIRAEQLDSTAIFERLKTAKIPFADKYSTILNDLHESYVQELLNSQTIDFDDMIIRASNCVKDGKFAPKWKFILVDEFQDISGSRMDFLKHIISKGPNPKLTVVGDDWQSIYRFSGGKLELTTRFSELVGSNTVTKLQKTFRYNNSIADTAGTFIMENKEQYKKEIITHDTVDTPQIFLLDNKVNDTEDMALKALQIVKKIRKQDSLGSIAVLSRYKYLLRDAKEEISNARLKTNVDFWTFHGSKGLEADYCILTGFEQGKLGFPNENKENEVVEALLPSLDSFPHSEERRLMYVALTRAKKKAYIIANPSAPSDFINELTSDKYDIHIASESFQEMHRKKFKCPNCVDGYFKKIEGKFGEFYSCSSKQACKIKARICKACGSPSIDDAQHSVCSNDNCNEKFKICPKCARPMKLRKGPFGEFYGCSGYGLKNDSCNQKIKIKT